MKKIFCLALTLALGICCLGGCGKSGASETGLYYEASGIPSDKVLLTVDGWEVTAQEYFYWLTYNCDYISSYYQNERKIVDWSGDRNGQTLGEYAKAQARNTCALYAVIESWAQKYHLSVTEEDQKGIDAQWDAAAEQAGGEEAYLASLAGMGVDKAFARQISADYYLYSHLYELYQTEGSELHPDQADVERYAQEKGFLTVEAILLSTADAADDAARQKKRAEADEVLEKLNASSNPQEEFSALADTYSDGKDRDRYPNGFTFVPGSGTMPEAFDSAAQGLEENKWSGVVETADGYYIILRRPLDMDAVSADYFDDMLQTAADNAKLQYSDEYGAIDTADFYGKLTAARAKLDTAAGTSSAFGTLPAASASAQSASGSGSD